jgi:iron complex transport system ATP-binding protein
VRSCTSCTFGASGFQSGFASNWAAVLADHLVVMGDGRIAAQGVPGEVLSEQLLADVFGLRAKVVEVGGAPVVVPDRRLLA